MKSSKKRRKSGCAKKGIAALFLAMLLIGCAPTGARIVKIDSFCEDKYESLWLTDLDYKNILELSSSKYKGTIEKYLNYHFINEREYDQCPHSAKNQNKN